MTRVLVVDDEPQLLRGLRTNLEARGYEVDAAADGEAALDLAARNRPDAVILDLGLPGIDGIEVIRALRVWGSMPIIVLSAREQEPDKIAALDAGADDYVTKPFGMGELLARLRASERRAAPAEETAAVTTHAFTVDLAAKKVTTRDGAPVHLTPTEWHLVEMLVRYPGQVGEPTSAFAGGLGSAVRGRDELSTRVHGADPSQARARSRATRATSRPKPGWAIGSSPTTHLIPPATLASCRPKATVAPLGESYPPLSDSCERHAVWEIERSHPRPTATTWPHPSQIATTGRRSS